MLDQDQNKRDILISKSLSYLLRHGAIKENLSIDLDGYVPVYMLLSHHRLKTHRCTIQDIHRIVASNDKKRFHIKIDQDKELICATQGHSIKEISPTSDILQEISTEEMLPPKLIHGTNIKNGILILKSGFIKPMNRNHVHLSIGISGKDQKVISGMRLSSTVHIYLNVRGILSYLRIFKSLNDVYLTPQNIPLALFEKVVIIKRSSDSLALNNLIDLINEKHLIYEVIN